MGNINTCAIIAEYNPLHNGHMYHIRKTREILGSVPIICIMSGHFTQRGEPAIADKWTRAKWAVENGCDAVIELPTVYAIQSANRFAGGAISIAKGIPSVSHLCFGCETDNKDDLKKISDYKTTDDYSSRLSMSLKSGNTFARAQQIALSKLDVDKNILSDNPNCILAIEYMSFLRDTNISPTIIKRTPNNHNDHNLLHGITSATSIRKAVYNGDTNISACVPYNVYDGLTSSPHPVLNDFTSIVLSKIFSMKETGLKEIHEINEGLENRIYKEALKATTLSELIENVKTKRYIYVRLQRIMLNILLDITKEFVSQLDNNNFPTYARLLAINSQRSSILSGTNENMPILSKAADYKHVLTKLQQRIFEKDMLATAMYSLVSAIKPNEDLTHQVIKI